jgi:chorismate dehydratase
MRKTQISIVSYLNSKPFLFGLNRRKEAFGFKISLDNPAKIVTNLSSGVADIGLIPVAGLADLNKYQIVSNYCIGAVGKVRTVVLVSDVPLEKIETILMDYQSRSSVMLAKILARNFWEKSFKWENTGEGFQHNLITGATAAIVIGDRVFAIEDQYKYSYDLSEEWYKFTGLPFVFAVWATTKNALPEFEKSFNDALKYGIDNIQKIVKAEQSKFPEVDILGYFNKNISFVLDKEKLAGMEKFLELAKELELVSM